MEQRIKDLEERIIALEGQVRMLRPRQPPLLRNLCQLRVKPRTAAGRATVPAQAPVSAEASARRLTGLRRRLCLGEGAESDISVMETSSARLVVIRCNRTVARDA